MINKIIPQTMTGQINLLVLGALLIPQIFSLFIFLDDRSNTVELAYRRQIAQQVITTIKLLKSTQSDEHNRIFNIINNRSFNASIVPSSSIKAIPKKSYSASRFKMMLSRLLNYKSDEIIIENLPKNTKTKFQNDETNILSNWLIYIKLDDQVWVRFIIRTATDDDTITTSDFFIIMGLCFFVFIIITQIMNIRLVKPLINLTKDVTKLKQNKDYKISVQNGPLEIKHLAKNFNKMQKHLNQFSHDRTQMLAAISHDLLTPVTTLRLRCEMIMDQALKEKFLQTLEQMESMIKTTLSFARTDVMNENTRTVEIGALLESIADDFINLGKHIIFNNNQHPILLECRPIALKRAITNILNNAFQYGNIAHIESQKDEHDLIITIKDNGPGIPEDKFEEVFKPFTRLDPSRNAEQGSVGLGLSITRNIIKAHGGSLKLQNLSEGGLKVSIILPLNG
ncbi:MAG: hypothetical protein K1X44_04360 [Alphaproteobacteria bacterium]|nr:hypothetical protein [Alphaproteobacteria bacterium]